MDYPPVLTQGKFWCSLLSSHISKPLFSPSHFSTPPQWSQVLHRIWGTGCGGHLERLPVCRQTPDNLKHLNNKTFKNKIKYFKNKIKMLQNYCHFIGGYEATSLQNVDSNSSKFSLQEHTDINDFDVLFDGTSFRNTFILAFYFYFILFY